MATGLEELTAAAEGEVAMDVVDQYQVTEPDLVAEPVLQAPAPAPAPAPQAPVQQVVHPTKARKSLPMLLPPSPATSDSDSEEEGEGEDEEEEQVARGRKRRSSHHSHYSRSRSPSSCSSSRSVSPPPPPLRIKKEKGHHQQQQQQKKKKSSQSKAPAAIASKCSQQMDRDAKLVAPLPFMRFLSARLTPKACGRCVECKKPACGQCKACVQNAKSDAKRADVGAAAAAAKGVTKDKDRRRCEALRCSKDAADSTAALPQGVPEDKDAIAEELAKVSSDLAEMSVKRGQADFNEKQYTMLIERMRALREGHIILKNRKARRRAKFQVGFHDVWGVLTSLERDRLKFAKFIVRTGSSEECRTIDMKRAMRDDLEAMQLEIAHKHTALLCPFEEKEAFMAELEKTRL